MTVRHKCLTEGCTRNTINEICSVCASKSEERIAKHREVAKNTMRRIAERNRDFYDIVFDFSRMRDAICFGVIADTIPETGRKRVERRGRTIRKVPYINKCTMSDSKQSYCIVD